MEAREGKKKTPKPPNAAGMCCSARSWQLLLLHVLSQEPSRFFSFSLVCSHQRCRWAVPARAGFTRAPWRSLLHPVQRDVRQGVSQPWPAVGGSSTGGNAAFPCGSVSSPEVRSQKEAQRWSSANRDKTPQSTVSFGNRCGFASFSWEFFFKKRFFFSLLSCVSVLPCMLSFSGMQFLTASAPCSEAELLLWGVSSVASAPFSFYFTFFSDFPSPGLAWCEALISLVELLPASSERRDMSDD